MGKLSSTCLSPVGIKGQDGTILDAKTIKDRPYKLTGRNRICKVFSTWEHVLWYFKGL